MSKFKSGDKAEFIERYGGYKIGDVVEIIDVVLGGAIVNAKGKQGIFPIHSDSLKLVEPKPSKNQRITALEKEVAELKAIVHELRKPSMVEENKSKLKGITIELEKTPNQQRKEIIEKAKEFVDFLVPYISDGYDKETKYGNIDRFISIYIYNVKFEVNEQKRTVVALLRGKFSKVVHHRGIAKCNPSDVFNEHIGKAIALGRALELDVSEFEQAVQPTFAKGQIAIGGNVFGDEPREVTKILNGNRVCRKSIDPNVKGDESWDYAELFTILNDTNAIY